MPSKRSLHLPLLLAALCVALPASAQIYQWKDPSGKTVISDKPPAAGIPLQKKIDAPSPAQTGSPQPSLTDRDLEFRKRQLESQEQAEKAEKEAAAAAKRNENCQVARQQLQTLESGERIALRNDKGERYFMDDARREQEIAKVRDILETTCQ
ncbi:MAG: DUF4124 domain-containing protein [Candidatus Accumulibacter sp.]|nr:DUF4124 domain-containing protein [Accumulibacter sp.]